VAVSAVSDSAGSAGMLSRDERSIMRSAGLGNALVTVVRAEGVRALYKGLAPTLVGIAPYAAINFASYDLLKRRYYGDGSDRRCCPCMTRPS